MRGMYAIYLEVWMRYWKRSDILVLKAEDYFASPDKTMQQVGRMCARSRMGHGTWGRCVPC